MSADNRTRRYTIFGFTALVGGLLFSRRVDGAGLTPGATEGPFYPRPPMRMADVDNDLVKITGLVREAGGEVITLQGRVVSDEGVPLAGRRIEIWQCDMNGKYLHPGDSRSVEYDRGFQGFGFDITDHQGNYRFRTIKPARYPGRTPHIHVKIFDNERELLTTQFYIKATRRIPAMAFTAACRQSRPQQCRWNLSMERTVRRPR